MALHFHNDDAKECAKCKRYIIAGDNYLLYKGEPYCSEDCLKEELFDECEYEECRILTAEDKENDYADFVRDDVFACY